MLYFFPFLKSKPDSEARSTFGTEYVVNLNVLSRFSE